MDYARWSENRDPQWYAIWTRSRQEKSAAAVLQALGVSHFLPLISEERQWSDRKKIVTVPAFPGYIFVQIAVTSDLESRVRQVPGFVNFVGNQNGPSPVREDEIENLRALLSRAPKCFPCPFLKTGDKVRIVRGVMAGIEGSFIRGGARSRVMISVEIIQRSIAVEVSANDVEPVEKSLERQAYATFAPSPCLNRFT